MQGDNSGSNRYVVISSDCHAGADLPDYKPYLEQKLAGRVRRVGRDLLRLVGRHRHRVGVQGRRLVVHVAGELGQQQAARSARVRGNRRRGDLPEHDAAVLPERVAGGAGPEDRDEYERRWAGIKAHNRWLKDFCDDDTRSALRCRAVTHRRRRRGRRRDPVGERSRTATSAVAFRPSREAASLVLREPRSDLVGLRRARHADRPARFRSRF